MPGATTTPVLRGVRKGSPGSIGRRNAFFEGGSSMYLRSDSAAGVRFLASMREGRGLTPSARAAGVGKQTGYRWLREAFVALREQGVGVAAGQASLGYFSPLVARWEQQRVSGRRDRRHHLAVGEEVEDAFWASFLGGETLGAACRAAGVSRASAYRWWRRRFTTLREQGVSVRSVARKLRLPRERSAVWEAERRKAHEQARRERAAVEQRAVRESARHVELLHTREPSKTEQRDTRYWELMRSGLTNTAACKLLGVTRRTGVLIRTRHRHQSVAPAQQGRSSGRYLSLHERLQVADLLRLGCSMRRIAAELGRSPSTIKRELDRHRDERGRYLPQTADHAARVQRRRPREPKLAASPWLRKLVQRKLNRCWSPDEISGWLRRTYPDDKTMWLCAETIYRALLVPGGTGLHKRYCRKLRTGRRIRKSRWLTRSGHGAVVRDMTMIDQRPAQVETKLQAGHWEGDLVLGVRSGSAMMTLRERKTQYGIVINLPADHTAETVNAAAIKAFDPLPRHMKRTLTWDQGVEMARHRELATATGISIYFAERSSPWQRGANENYNGLLRQYFPKGTDLSVHTENHVAAVMSELNTRPRKGLGYDTPQARFRAEMRGPLPSTPAAAVTSLAT
jgi:transposase, IS30 family